VGVFGSIPPAKRRWRRTLRAGLFWTALGLGAATISYALTLDMAARSLGFERRYAELFFALIPIPPVALGVDLRGRRPSVQGKLVSADGV